MKPEYTQEQLLKLKQALKDKVNAVHYRNLQAIIFYPEGISLVKARESTWCVHQTIHNLSNHYLARGLSAILRERRKTAESYMMLEAEQSF